MSPYEHPDDTKVAALADLDHIGWRATVAKYGVSQSTLSRWRWELRVAGDVLAPFTAPEKSRLAARWLAIQERELDLTEAALEGLSAPETWRDYRDAKVSAGISTTKLQDLTEGRSGTTVAVAAPSVHLDGLDPATLRALLGLPPAERTALLLAAQPAAVYDARAETAGIHPSDADGKVVGPASDESRG